MKANLKRQLLIVLTGIFSISILLLSSGCATGFPNGLIYTHVKLPVTAAPDYSQIKDTKKGTAYCKKFLGLVAWGDASIEAAAKNCPSGQIKKIQRVEYEAVDCLGCGTYYTHVYGE
jgi:hypothetical protein